MKRSRYHLPVLIMLLAHSCAIATFGKFQAATGVPAFLQAGKTTRDEVYKKLGEPLVHRIVAGRETMIYNNERARVFIFFATYSGYELIIRFKDGIVTEGRVEKTGDGWAFFFLQNFIQPGTRRSGR